MRRLLVALLLGLAGTANAALPRVVLGTPVAPTGSAPAAMAASAASQAMALPAAAPVAALPLARQAGLAAAPVAALSAPAAAVSAAPAAAPALAALPIPSQDEAPRRAAEEAAGPRFLKSLTANAPLADSLSANLGKSSLEEAAPAFERNFAAAAGLEPGDDASSAANAPSGPSASDPLLARLLAKVHLDDGGVPERRVELIRAFERMLQSPTARDLAERFLADGAGAVVRFEPFEGSRVYDANGRKIFYAPRAYTEWQEGRVVVRLNLDYLGTDAEFQTQDLPPTIAHELFGHGLWYSRAARQDVVQAFHHHELNETNARLVGWLVDFELDKRFEENGAWSYLQDPAGFLGHLKLRLLYYALTFSSAELGRPVEAMEARSTAAKAKRERLRTELANHVSWNPVIDHFAKHHGLEEKRLRALRGYMADTEQSYKDDLAVMDALIAEVDATVERMKAEPDRRSENYLRSAAALPLFADLQKETEENTRRLQSLVGATPAQPTDESPDAARLRAEHWRGQVTFEEMVEMYRRDRERNPGHWTASR